MGDIVSVDILVWMTLYTTGARRIERKELETEGKVKL